MKINESVNRFDQIASEWDSDNLRVKLATSIAEKISSVIAIQKSDRILDFGCGTGLVAFSLLRYAAEAIGVDNSEGMIDQFNKKAKEYELLASGRLFDFESETIEKGSFDLAVSGMVFHHLQTPEKAVKELYQSLKPNGKIAIADLDTEDGSFHPADMQGIFHHGFKREDVLDWFKAAGFQNVKAETALEFEKEGKKYSIFLATGVVE
jgi:ubiquinone/menaquinone biosynthesis C-methylase UbiE